MKLFFLLSLFSFSAFSHVTEITGASDILLNDEKIFYLSAEHQDYLNGVSYQQEQLKRDIASQNASNRVSHVNEMTGTFQD